MALSLFLGVWSDNKVRKFKIDDIDPESNAETLKTYLKKELGEEAPEMLELTFCGLLLQDEKPLSNYGITSGSVIHVINKPQPKPIVKLEKKKVTEEVIQEFVSNYRKFRISPLFRNTLHRLECPDELDTVIAAVPGLKDDPIAIAFISKPDLFTQMEDPKTCWQIAEKNPLILTAASYIVSQFHQTTSANSSSSFPLTIASGHSYSLDALSDDDDDMEGDGPSSQGAITAAHLAAALASATPYSRITPEALQQALSPSNTRYTTQLRQMVELGLNDEGRNIRALTAANGDLQAAIELVFSGVFDD